LLRDGKVLVEGGDPATDAIAGAELFDPATGTWTRTGAMAGPRRMQAATLLADGQVLIAGGHDGQAALATAELYNPADGRFGPTGSLPEPISLPSAVLLEDGRVLLAGGLGADGNPTAAAFLYDPAADGWTKTGSMPVSRVRPVLTRLDDGRVLVFDTGATAVDLYDPRTGTFGPTGAMAVGHTTATLLGDGRVLVAGGDTDEAELYDPKTGTFGPTEPLNSAAPIDAAVALLDGRVLLVRGGEARSELFDPGSTHTVSSSSPAASPTAAPTPPDACSLLTSADVSAIRGVPVGPGDPSNGSAGTPDCQWLPEDGDGDPVLQIAIWFDDPRLWSSLATHPYFTPATIDGHPALVNGDPAQGQTIWVEVPRYVISIGALSPQPDGAKTPDREQQLAILARILAHLH
jgi:hypothetical protein